MEKIVCKVLDLSYPTPGPIITPTLASILNPLLVGLVGGIAAAIGELSGYAVGATGRQALEGSRIYERFQALAQRRVGPALFVFAALRSIRYRWHMGGHCPLLATALPAIRDCGQGHKSHNFCIRRILWNELASRLIISYVARITFLVIFCNYAFASMASRCSNATPTGCYTCRSIPKVAARWPQHDPKAYPNMRIQQQFRSATKLIKITTWSL